MVCTAIVRPYKYMGRYCPKEGKNRRKVTNFLRIACVLLLLLSKLGDESFGRLREVEIEMKEMAEGSRAYA